MAVARRILTAAVAMMATVALLFAGQAVAREATVTSPVAQAMRLGGVRAYHLNSLDTAHGAVPTVTVSLRDGVDLEAVAESLTSRLEPILGTSVVLDPSGPAQARLRAVLELLALPVNQGVATGQFVAMARAVRAMASARHLRCRVEVDASAVYVTLTGAAGEGSAYAIFPRAEAPATGTAAVNGQGVLP